MGCESSMEITGTCDEQKNADFTQKLFFGTE
jgi:hypothetical protein